MSNKKEIIQAIKAKIKQNYSKTEIENELASNYEAKEYEKILKDFPEPELKEKYRGLNGLLIACIIVVTLFKLLSIVGIALELGVVAFLIFLMVGLFIPVVLIVYLLAYRASGYIATAILTIVSFSRALEGLGEIFASKNAVWIGLFVFQLVMITMIVALSIYLFKKIYPNYKLFLK